MSIASVSAALNGTGRVGSETRERVRRAAEQIGYRPSAVARSLQLGRSSLIGMVVADITNPFNAGLVRVVEKAAIARGHSVIVCNLDNDHALLPAIIERLRDQSVAGMLVSPFGPQAALLPALSRADLPPTVTFDQRVPGLARDFVGFDNRLAMRMLVDHLAALGHRRIALLTGRPGHWTADERHAGFVEAMAAAGLPADPALIARCGFAGEEAYAVAGAMLRRRNRPTAVVAANNTTALGALQGCLEAGLRCPGDVSIVGVDDVPWGSLVQPRLTLVAQPLDIMGTVATEWLLDRIEAGGPPGPREMILAPVFCNGGSCGPPEAGPATAANNVPAHTNPTLGRA